MDRRGIKAGCRIKGAALQADDRAATLSTPEENCIGLAE
jgi:hypothetical protein